ncbi:MAG: hypothetical protein L0323_10260 [Planctomycetes bacterium]|nr:hypothetical protein [Planctomycetota bacterium]
MPSRFTILALTSPAEGAAMLARVPAALVPNLWPWEHSARFVARIGGVAVFLEEGGSALSGAGLGTPLVFLRASVWINPASPPSPPLGVSASGALAITVQPWRSEGTRP